MRYSSQHERVLAVTWQQSAAGDWVAALTDKATGIEYMVSSVAELEGLLRDLLYPESLPGDRADASDEPGRRADESGPVPESTTLGIEPC